MSSKANPCFPAGERDARLFAHRRRESITHLICLAEATAATVPLPAVRHHHRRRGHWAGRITACVAAAVVVLAVAAYGIRDTHTSRPASSWPSGVAYRICPVADCAGYPVPSQVRGITLAALQNWLLFTRSVRAQVRAARAWHVNTIRLQIVQDKLVGADGDSFSPGYMRDVAAIISYALHRHLAVVVNAQTEISLGFVRDETLPTRATWAFWRHMAARYGHDRHVVFDLFNEPRDCGWDQWETTMQHLVDYLRGLGARNQLWVEGRWWGSTLAGVPLLHGQGIVYSFHHPGSPWPWQLPVGPATWDTAFGTLAAHGVPVVDGEFVNFMGGYYWPRSTQMVTEYLRYLAIHHIGVVAWSLQPGIMTATTDLASAVSEPQGAGRLLWRYFWGRPLPVAAAAPYSEVVPRRFG